MTGALQLLHHESELGWWDMISRPPDARLGGFVTRYAGWWERTTFFRRREVPSTGVVLIVNFGQLRVVHPSLGHALEVRDGFACGLIDHAVLTESDGSGGGVQVDFTPIGARLFFGIPMHELARAYELEEVLGDGRHLGALLRDLPTWEERFDYLDRFILRRLARAELPARPVVEAWNRLVRTGGNASIGALAEEAGWTGKHLTERFRDTIGLAPKTAARVIRFERAVRLSEKRPDLTWADVAAACGYYDQPHFNRDFRELAGMSPHAFARARLDGQWDVLDDQVDSVQGSSAAGR